MLVTRGFKGKSRGGPEDRRRLPPGQFLTPEFPVLSEIVQLVNKPIRNTVQETVTVPIASSGVPDSGL